MSKSNLGNVVNSRLKYFAAAIIDNVPYIRNSRSYFKDDVAGKKAGQTYKFYVPDPGKAYVKDPGADGAIDITNDQRSIWELPVSCTLRVATTSVDVADWYKLTAIEDFARDIASPHGASLAAEIERKIIDENAFRSDSGIVFDGSSTITGKPFAVLSARLRAIRSAGKKIGFAHPDVWAGLSDNLMGKFLPNDVMKKIYGDSLVGHAFGSDWIEENYMPIVKVGSAPTLTSINWGTGEVVGTNLVNGVAFKLSNGTDVVNTVDLVGKRTNEPFFFIITNVNAAGTAGKLQLDPEAIRFMNELDANGSVVPLTNPTIGFERYDAEGNDRLGTIGSSSGNYTATCLLTANKTYQVIQVRDADALEFDTYELPEVAGAKNEKLKAWELSIQSSEQGNNFTRKSVVRFDVPFISKLVLTKLSRTGYIQID